MFVRRVVLLKAVVDDQFRTGKLQEIEAALERVALSRQQLDYQEQRLRSLPETVPQEEQRSIVQKIALERRKQDGLEKRLRESRSELESLPDGAEFLIGRTEGLVEPMPGMAFAGLTRPAEIILKDGLIAEIRE